MSDGITDVIQDNKSAIVSTNSTIASMGLESMGKSAAGKLVSPAVWALDWAANDQAPDAVDIGLYGMGLIGGVVGIAAAGTGIVKALVDDDTNRKLETIRAAEPGKFRAFIHPCVDYGFSGQGINAMTIASEGGTAWEHPNGLWAYIVDATGKLVCDYRPAVAERIYQPLLPLRPTGGGKFRWHSIRGGA